MSLLDERLDKNVPIPLYFQLKNLILSDIRAGLIPAGETIPTEQQLSEHFQISRSTVRQAISELTREGWLTRRASKGTFVTEPHQTAHYIHSFEPFYQQVERQNRKPSTELLGLEVLTATPELAEKLGLENGDQIISMFRRRLSDGVPMVTIQNYMPYSLCAFVLGEDFTIRSLYELLMTHPQTQIDSTTSVVSVEFASSDDVRLLQIKKSTPMLCFHNVSRTKSGVILDYAFSRYRGDLTKFEFIDKPKTGLPH